MGSKNEEYNMNNDEIYEKLLRTISEEANIDTNIDQNLYPKPDWAVKQVVRSTGLVEDICEHGIGHPNEAWMKLHDPDGEKGYGIHGCDGCCADEETRMKIWGR